MYAEYPAILSAYLELRRLADDPAIALEALKRLVFLCWYAVSEPSIESGISELPESSVREVMRELDAAIAAERADDELRMMLARYDAVFGYVFEHFGPVRRLGAFIAGVSAANIPPPGVATRQFAGRGQLGRYWQHLLESMAD